MATKQGFNYYTKEEIDEKLLDDFIYSTAEKACGKWIDGSTIYKKTVEFGTLPNATNKIVAHGITNLEQFIEVKGIAVASNRRALPLPYNTTLYVNADATNITISASGDRSGYVGYVTLYYTKNA